MARPDPLKVLCPHCGALPDELCSHGAKVSNRFHDARLGEAIRQQILGLPPVVRSL